MYTIQYKLSCDEMERPLYKMERSSMREYLPGWPKTWDKTNGTKVVHSLHKMAYLQWAGSRGIRQEASCSSEDRKTRSRRQVDARRAN